MRHKVPTKLKWHKQTSFDSISPLETKVVLTG